MQTFNITIVVDHETIENWKYGVIEGIRSSKYTNLVNIVNLNDEENKWTDKIYPQGSLLRFFKKEVLGVDYDALTQKNIYSINNKVLSFSEIDHLKHDIIVNLSVSNIEKNNNSLAKYGIWRFFFSKKDQRRSINVGKYEYMQAQGYINIGIIADNFCQQSFILHRKKSGMDHISLRSSIENVLWGCINFIPMLMRRLALYGEKNLIANKERYLPEKRNNEENNILPLAYPSTTFKRYLHRAISRYIFDTRWMLLFSYNKNNSKGYLKNPPFHTYHRLSPPRGMFWADPFIVIKDNESYIFFEELSYKDWRGYICYIKINADKSFTKPKKILQQDYHLSYPFIFQYEGSYYMIPESAENRTIELYKCNVFPEKWEFQTNIMQDVHACDTTLIEHNGRWWMFSLISNHHKCMDTEDLHIFYSDNPLSNNWTAHKNNPVVSDATNARPAGKIFSSNGKLYRPSQSCAATYGKGLNINEIIELSTENYQEKKIYEDTAKWSSRISGLHTYNHEGNLSVSDIFSY